MERRSSVLITIGLLLIFMQSSCVKKVAPVSGSAGLGEGNSSGFNESDDRSVDVFSGDDGGLREEAIQDEPLREESVFQTPREEIEPERAPSLEFRDIFFDYDRAALTEQAEMTLRENAKTLMQFPKIRIRISGHTDERGSNEYNLALGARRARTVKQFLEAFGVEPGRIEIISYGEENPFCKEKRESCFQQNRRAHFFMKPER